MEKLDSHTASLLAKQGINKDFVELVNDFAPRSRGKEHSPYARFYRDKVSGKRIMVAGILPHIKVMGHPIEPAWFYSDKKGKWYSRANLFGAIVDGTQIKVTASSDQPSGSKKGDYVIWNPQLFLDDVEIQPKSNQPDWLEIDPVNSNYHQNVLEWDYGIDKRRLRIIEGRITEKWSTHFRGIYEIRHNPTGDLPLKYGRCSRADGMPIAIQVIGDREIVDTTNLPDSAFPIEIGASPETFYPDPHPENTSVDGNVRHQYTQGFGVTWNTIVGGVGTAADDTIGATSFPYILADNVTDRWLNIIRGIILFDISGLPACTVTGVTLSIWGRTAGADNLSITPKANVYSSAPANNDALVAGDFNSVGTAAYATGILQSNWTAAQYNVFTFNADPGRVAVQAAADGDGILKLGIREETYDVAEQLDPGNHAPNWASLQISYFAVYCADQGNTTNDPKLVVTYTILLVPVTDGDLIGIPIIRKS